MSIINDALKKTQKKLKKISHTEVSPQKNVWLWTATVIVMVGFIGCVLVFIFILYPKDKRLMESIAANVKDALKATTEVVSAPTPPPEPAPQQPVAHDTSAPSPKTAPTLNGIIAMDGDYFALIDNQIFKEGEYVNGQYISSIDANSVEILREDGKRMILKTGR